MNHVFLVGNLADDPKTGLTTNGVTKCTFRLATQRTYANPLTGQYEADFHTIIVWRKQAENCAKYLRKGRSCAVLGSIQYRSYEAKDGSKRYVTEIVADEVQFLGGGTKQQDGNGAIPGGMIPVETDELPF